MESPHGSHTSQLSAEWKVFGEKIPRSEIVYFAHDQLFMCVALIITCVVMLALHDPNRKYWMVVFSSLVGYIMPSPHILKIKFK